MQQNERKGAWTLFVAILVFGALVWGYGGYERDKARKESIKVSSEMSDKIVETDTTEYKYNKVKTERKIEKKDLNKGGKKVKGKVKSKADSKENVRDILADPIKTDSE